MCTSLRCDPEMNKLIEEGNRNGFITRRIPFLQSVGKVGEIFFIVSLYFWYVRYRHSAQGVAKALQNSPITKEIDKQQGLLKQLKMAQKHKKEIQDARPWDVPSIYPKQYRIDCTGAKTHILSWFCTCLFNGNLEHLFMNSAMAAYFMSGNTLNVLEYNPTNNVQICQQ